MSDIIEQMQDLLHEKALECTLSRDALERLVNDIKEKEKRIESLTKKVERLEDKDKALNDYIEKYNNANYKLQEWHKREEELKQRELRCLEIEIQNKYENKRSEDLKDTLQLFLRNTNYRRTLQSEQCVVVPPPVPDQYGNMQYGIVQTQPTQTTQEDEEC